MKEIFLADNMDITFANTGEEGIDLAKELNPDIILFDTILPKKDGFEVCRELKANEGVNSKIIILTGQLQAYDQQRAIDAGADGYCLKLAEPIISAVLKLSQS